MEVFCKKKVFLASVLIFFEKKDQKLLKFNAILHNSCVIFRSIYSFSTFRPHFGKFRDYFRHKILREKNLHIKCRLTTTFFSNFL